MILKTSLSIALMSLLLSACSSSIGPDETTSTQANLDTVSDASTCDLSQVTGTYDVVFTNPQGTCPRQTGITVLWTLPYINLTAGNCAGPNGHTQGISANGCTLTAVCDFIDDPTASRDYEEIYKQTVTFSSDLSSFTGTVTGAPIAGDASCTGSWTITGTLAH